MILFAVNEVFETIQGEAHYTGSPSVFIRMQGCAVGCAWCDTKHTWDIDPMKAVPIDTMLQKTADAPTYAHMTANQLVEVVACFKARHVVITGGEPCDYDLTGLGKAFIEAGRSVQVETSGTSDVRVSNGTWVTLSPKINMPGRKPVLDEALRRAHEIKMPVGKPADIDQLRNLLFHIDRNELWTYNGPPLVWLQPLSTSKKATALCIEQATANGWRVSLQTHKFAGLR